MTEKNKKVAFLIVRVTEEQKQTLTQRAKKLGLKLSALLRNILLK